MEAGRYRQVKTEILGSAWAVEGYASKPPWEALGMGSLTSPGCLTAPEICGCGCAAPRGPAGRCNKPDFTGLSALSLSCLPGLAGYPWEQQGVITALTAEQAAKKTSPCHFLSVSVHAESCGIQASHPALTLTEKSTCMSTLPACSAALWNRFTSTRFSVFSLRALSN